jgi:DNA-binding CsgD family transcriptional regulator
VEFLAQARPHLVQAYRNALDHTALKRQVGAASALPRADLAAFGLSPREVDVVRRVAAGLRNDDIGEQLGVSGRTVQKHLERAYRKLGVRSRSEAAKVAWRLDADRERRGGAAAPPYADSA